MLILYFQDEEINEVLKSSERIEYHFGHFFDETVVNKDLNECFSKLQEAILTFENESSWVPVTWCN